MTQMLEMTTDFRNYKSQIYNWEQISTDHLKMKHDHHRSF